MSGWNDYLREHKIVVVGATGVGKSSLITRFCSAIFPPDHEPTIEDSYRRQIVVDNEAVQLLILDTAGEGDNTMSNQWYSYGHGFLLVYSSGDRASFEAVKQLHSRILAAKGRIRVPCVLVCNKCDLADGAKAVIDGSRERSNEREHSIAGPSSAGAHLSNGNANVSNGHADASLAKSGPVSNAEAVELAHALRAPFVETSALQGINIDTVFAQVVRRVRRAERGRQSQHPPDQVYQLKTRRMVERQERETLCGCTFM